MDRNLDGDYQTIKSPATASTCASTSSAAIPETAALIAHMSDEDIWGLNRGGHDPFKVYAAYKAAVEPRGQPTVILAKTIKGYGMGGPAKVRTSPTSRRNSSSTILRAFRDRFSIPVSDNGTRYACRSSGRPEDSAKRVS